MWIFNPFGFVSGADFLWAGFLQTPVFMEMGQPAWLQASGICWSCSSKVRHVPSSRLARMHTKSGMWLGTWYMRYVNQGQHASWRYVYDIRFFQYFFFFLGCGLEMCTVVRMEHSNMMAYREMLEPQDKLRSHWSLSRASQGHFATRGRRYRWDPLQTSYPWFGGHLLFPRFGGMYPTPILWS